MHHYHENHIRHHPSGVVVNHHSHGIFNPINNSHGHYSGNRPIGVIHHSHNDSASDFLCCGLLLTGLLACLNPRLAFVCVLAIGAIIIIACLASLAMSVTGETLLSLFLIGLVITGLAMLCDRNNVGCCPQERADNHDNLNPNHFRT